MKKFFALCLAAILSLAVVLIANASLNPFKDYFKFEASRLSEKGIAQNVFAVFDDDKNQVKSNIALVYNDNTGQMQEALPDYEGRIFIKYTDPSYIKVLKIRIDGVEYDIKGEDAYGKFDLEDINKGYIEFKVIQYKPNSKSVYIYDAD